MWVLPFDDKFLTGHFGKIRDFRKSVPHRGTDWAPGAGRLIPAIASGTVVTIKLEKGLGWIVETKVTDHKGKTWYITYCHVQDQPKKLKVGDAVEAGVTHVAKVGNTGTLTTGAHLHATLSKVKGGYKAGLTHDIYKKIKEEQKAVK